jgi:hypothetical protein
MTDAEKMAANRVVAEAMGWHDFRPSKPKTIRPKDSLLEFNFAGGSLEGVSPEGAVRPIPDIFANTEAGAWAREQAAGWLLAQGIGDMGVWHSSSLAFYFDEPTWFVKIGPAPRCSGKTIGEATAAAIHAAVVALGAGEGEKP